ncbi:MAG TPA: zf-TFIIB domain-containing protein [Blastocatellia bacterium]|nr:zf-TFIIB domain-containing protein [Blastocatellia bacterium]
MNCPKCNVELRITDRESVEVDYCPLCRGVWLDRGELDKIIERSASYESRGREYDDDDDDEYKRRERYGKQHGHSHKRKGFLGDLFDFD